jgi:hypothetical protein
MDPWENSITSVSFPDVVRLQECYTFRIFQNLDKISLTMRKQWHFYRNDIIIYE